MGLKLNFSKCQLNPAYQCKYLGYILDSKEFCISLPEKKKHEILDLALNLRIQEKCKIRKVAEFLGKLAWACLAIRYGSLYTKALSEQRSEGDFDKTMSLPIKVKSELDCWIKNISKSRNPINEGHYKIVIFSDASRSGWGVCCQEERTHG